MIVKKKQNKKIVTGAGELTEATLYPYWKDEPNEATRLASTKTIDSS